MRHDGVYGSRCSEQHNLTDWTEKRALEGVVAIFVSHLFFNLVQITLFLYISSSSQALWSRLISYNEPHSTLHSQCNGLG